MWPALLVIAASALLKGQANKQAAHRQENLRSAMEAYQRQKASETEGATQQLIAKQTPTERDTELANVTADRTQSLRDTVGAAQAFNTAPIAGKVSSDYQAAQQATAGRVAERTRRAIEQLATIGAPGEQQQRFGLRFGRAAGTVDAANRAGENVGRGYMTDINNVRPNPTMSMIGDLGMTVGGAMAGGAAGADAGAVNNGQGYTDAAGNLYSDNVTRQQRLARGFSLWGS